MRTTLKRGIGRRPRERQRPRASCPPRAARADHALPAAVAGAAAAGRRLGRIVVALAGCSRRAARRVGARRRRRTSTTTRASPRSRAHSKDVKVAPKHLDIPLPNQPAIALVVGYDKRARRTPTGVALGHDDAAARRPARRTSISMLSFPRDMSCRAPLPATRSSPPTGSTPRTRTAAEGRARDGEAPHRPADQLPRSPSTSAASRRSSTSSAASGSTSTGATSTRTSAPRVRTTRTSTSQPGYQQLNGRAGARLRALPAHRLRPLPARAPAAVRQGDEAADLEPLLGRASIPKIVGAITHNVEIGHAGGGSLEDGRSSGTRCFAYGLPVGPLLPDEDRRPRRVRRRCSAPTVERSQAAVAGLPDPRRRGAAERDRRRVRAEGRRRQDAAAEPTCRSAS